MRIAGPLVIVLVALLVAGCASRRSPARPDVRAGVRSGSIRGSIPARMAPGSIVMAWPADGASVPPTPPRRVRVSQSRQGFRPSVVLADPGTTIEFLNRDRVFHNAFSVQPAGRFDIGPYAPGQTRSIRLEHPGVYSIFCELHPKESGTLVIAPDRWHVRPRSDGNFILKDVPPGTYVVRVWHPSRRDVTDTVVVASNRPALIDLTDWARRSRPGL